MIPVLMFPAFDPVLVRFGPFAIRWYALAYIAGLVLGWRLMRRLVQAPPAVATPVQADDFLTWATLGVVLGGRIGYVLFYQPLFYLQHPATALAVEASRIKLPAAIAPFGDTIDELDFAAEERGTIPSGKLADAVAAWRDAGGKIELDNLRLKWGALDATATGTIGLDQELQPASGFSAVIKGYDQILSALVQNGQMRASDAGLARIALTFLAKAGPDGKPEIRTAFTIQNGEMFLGPAKLGRTPRITWE